EIMPHHVAQKCVAVTGAAAIVRLQNGIAFGSEYGHVILVAAEAEFIGCLRPAVGLNRERIPLSFLVIEGIVKQAFDSYPIRALPFNPFLPGKLVFADDLF